ncbi:proton-conducting transporter transmembrane domain-containing protein [Pedobacter arcticus]|uniref:proton-conducting transporter transmembrane domain-containing protein n=1 Tax=Pedobacter arcticus TaxID=752140 RepID=UPI000301A057|nr:proton-conducting transporter membrane subunit [Pedobacter arcticus]
MKINTDTRIISSGSPLNGSPTSLLDEKLQAVSSFANAINIFLWLFFLGSAILLVSSFSNSQTWNWGNIIRINGFTLLIWTTVTFFSAILSTYSIYYLAGFKYQKKFICLSLGFTLSVMLFIASNHVALLLLSWFAMGVFMANLIGVNSHWGEAREAKKFAQKYFLLGTLFLTAGVTVLAIQTNQFTLEGIIANLQNLSQVTLITAALLIIVAAIIQSAIYPFHRWLLSAMTAPTPASALMHAGFVNGAGILLTLFSTLIFVSNTFAILLIIGGLTAIIAQFSKLIQPNVKQKLGCSTIAQMGFMIMQCGLGFFNAAVVHLILHGFYKAYLFLSSGESVKQTIPENKEKIIIKPLQAIVVLIYGLVGALLFATLTGKGTEMNSGIFLTLIVAITVGQITYNIVKQQNLSIFQKAFVPPLLFFVGIGLYALIYQGVTVLMSSMPMVDIPLALSLTQIIFGIIFLIGFFIMKLGVFRNFSWLYVKLMNDSQPHHKTVLMFKSK